LQGAGEIGGFWKVIIALIECANGNSEKKEKRGVFTQRHESDCFKISGLSQQITQQFTCGFYGVIVAQV
jgi:hypothetical protein